MRSIFHHLAVCCLAFAVSGTSARAVILSVNPVADAFLRASAPDSNYGGAGALSVAGPLAVNGSSVMQGEFASVMRFDLAAVKTQFDSQFGVGGWQIDGANFQLTENATPTNAIFNRGTGTFAISWLATNTAWVEGTGNPNNPTTDGITWNGRAALFTAGVDVALGNFTNAGDNTRQTFVLPLNNSSFSADLAAGGVVSFYLTAVTPGIGFTFVSRTTPTVENRPVLAISAIAVPEPRAAALLAAAAAWVAGVRRRRR